MIEFNAIILQFDEQGEKTGWSYIDIPAHLAAQLKPGNKKTFRVRGMLDGLAVSGMALMPMGNGNFIMALKADVRKGIHKNKGAMVQVKIEEDTDYKVEIPDDLLECFEFEPEALVFFNGLTKSHRSYFIKWIESAKTKETRAKRIINTVNAMLRKWDYGQMIRAMKKD
ncbi:YdeI/OmpD-associated family protein [Mucilaginibacter sp.]|uniref:YdeI/OmpD-associated family protein n=1 Tax=Mucilaginibacter sp. TaxID=1882438 RepID=UPI003D0A6B24